MQVLVAVVLVVLAAAARLLPHPPNFAPVAAVALFAGAVLPRRWSFAVPFGALLVSDATIGFYEPPVMAAVYGSFLVIALLGRWAGRQRERAASVLGATLAGSVLFFLTTNAATWAWGGIYPRTAAGLMAAYAMGIPFYRNTLAGDLFYAGALFGLYAAATWLVRHRAWLRDLPAGRRHRQMLRHPHA